MASGVLDEEVRISVPEETDYLGVIRRVVTEIASRAGFDPLEAGEIEIAVDEVASSAVLQGPHAGRIVVRARVTDAALEVTVAAPAVGNFDEQVVRACVDEVESPLRSPSGPPELRLRRFRRRRRRA